MAVDHNIGIQIRRNDLTKTFTSPHSLYKKYISAVRVNPSTAGAAYIRVLIFY